jgi:hypothetical protein
MTARRRKEHAGQASQRREDSGPVLTAKPVRKRRGTTRFIDRMVAAPGSDVGVAEEDLRTLDQHWAEIDRKAVFLIVSRFEWSKRQAEPMTTDECLAMFQVLRALMRSPETDSERRRDVDMEIASDFIFHKEILKHDTVMVNLCARWGISESAAKQAVKSWGKQARETLHRNRLSHDQTTVRVKRDPAFAKELKEAMGMEWQDDWAASQSSWIRSVSKDYREGTNRHISRARAKRNKGK